MQEIPQGLPFALVEWEGDVAYLIPPQGFADSGRKGAGKEVSQNLFKGKAGCGLSDGESLSQEAEFFDGAVDGL